MDASAFFSSGPSPPPQQQQGQGHAPRQSDQFYGGSGGGTIGRANSMESDSEFETLDINEPPTTHHHHGGATSVGIGGSTAATNSGNNNHNNGAANFFGGQHPPPQQYGNQYQASSGPENFSMASSGPENFSMPSSSAAGNVSDYTNSNHQNYSGNNNSNYSASNNNYNNDHTSNHSNYSNNYNNQEPPMEYEGVALQTALNTFTAVGRLGGGLASNVIGGGSRLIGGGVTSGVGSVVGGAKNVVGGAKNAVGGASGMGNSVTSGMGSMMKGIGNFASGLVGVGEENDEIAAAMAQWAEGQKRLQQQGQQQGNGSVGQGQGNEQQQGNVGQGQQQQQHVQEGYLHQEHRHQHQPQPQQQYAQPQPQQGYNQTNTNNNNTTAQQVFNAPSPLSTPQFGATRNTTTATVGPPAMSLGAPATMESVTVTATTTAAPPGQYAAVSSNMVSSGMSRMSSNASAVDVFGSTTTTAPVSRMTSDASAADVVGSSSSVAAPVSRMTSNPSAADVFGSTTTTAAAASEIASASGSSGNASAENVFGSTTTTAAAASENVNSSTENVVGGTTTAATNVFGGGATSTNENTSAADVFGGATTTTTATENASAADVFGGTSAAPENASATDVFGGATTAASGNASSAENVFGAISANVNPAKDQVFGATNMAATVNASAADVFGTSASKAASASEVFAAVEATTTAADVFGGATYPPATAEEVLGGNEVTEIPTVVESIEPPPLPEGWAKGIDEASGNPYYYNSVTGESSWVLPEDKSNAAASTEQGNVAVVESAVVDVDALINAEEIKEQPLQQHPEIVHRQSSNQLSSLECAEHDPNFQYSDPLVGSAVAPATNAVAKPPVTGNVLAMEIGNYHPPTAMVTMMEQQQDVNISAPVDVPSVSENIVDSTTSTTNAVAKPPVTGNVLAMEIGNYHPPTAMVTMMEQQQDVNVSAPVDVPSVSEHVVAPVAVKEEMKKVVDAAPETETAVKMFEGTSIQHGTPPLVASSNTSTIASSPAESTEKHTITSSLAPPEKRPTVATSNTHRRFQLNLPKKASLPLPPPRNKKASSSVSGGGSLGSTSRKKKLSSSPFRKPPPMEVSATPRFHVPPPAGGSSVGSGGSGSHLHYPLPKAATPGSTSVLTTSPLPTPRVLDDGEDDNVPSSASPLLPAASTSAVVEPKVVETTESEPDVPKNASPDAPAAASGDGDRVSTEEPKVAEASIGTDSTPPVVFQPLELDQIVEAVATPSEEFKMELPKKEANYSAGEDIAGEDIVNNVASTMTQGVMHDAVLHVASTAINSEVPPPTYSLTTRPIYHKDELPKAESSLFTEDGASDYQSTLRDEDLPPISMSNNSEEENEVLLSVESEVAPTQVESEKLDAAPDTPKEDEVREFLGEAMASSSVVTEYPISDYQEQVTDEDFVIVDSSDVDNNVTRSNDAVPVSSSPWVETVDPASGQTYYYNQENGETSWQLPIEAAANEETVASTVVEPSPEVSPMADHVVEESVPADDANESPGVFEEPASMADDAIESPRILEDKVVVEPEITEEEAPLLPDGWVKGIDEASGNPYYYNSVTGESLWDLPSASTEQGNVAVESAPVDVRAGEEINDTDNVDEYPKVEVEHEEVAQVNADEAARFDSPTDGQVEGESGVVSEVGPLPTGWMEANDPSGRVFYFNSSTGQSSWERPKSVIPDNATEDLTPVVQPTACDEVEVVDTSVKIEDDAQVQIENLVLAEESVAPLEDDEDNLSFESLPPGWIETKDSASGQIYFYNEKTEESCWSRPVAMPDPAVNVASEVESDVKDESDIAMPETVEEPVPSEASINDEANIALADQEPVEEPRVNSEAVHEGSTYDPLSRPIMEIVDGQDEIAFPVDSALIPEESPQVGEDEIPEENDADLDLQESHANEFVEESTTAEEIVPLPEEELPAGWLSSIDETTSKIFYYNEETGESTWDKPSIKEAHDATKTVEVENSANSQQQIDGVIEEPTPVEETARPSSDESEKLPPGWSSSVDEASGNIFYYNDEGITSWDKPLIEGSRDKAEPEDETSVDKITEHQEVEDLTDGSGEPEEGKTDVGLGVSVDEGSVEDAIEVVNTSEMKKNSIIHDEVVEEHAHVEVTEAVPPSLDITSCDDELPPGWFASVDESSGKQFYYNEDGRSSWETPMVDVGDAASIDEGSIEQMDAKKAEVAELDGDVCETNVMDRQGPEAVEPSTAEKIVPSSEELPSGWLASIDETTGKMFYYNEETGESTWDKPSIKEAPDASPEDEVPADDIGAAESEEVENNANSQQQNDGVLEEPTPVEETARPSSDESEKLQPGWSSSVDEASGNIFYYNDEGITSWDKPSIEGSRDEAKPEDETSVVKITEHQEEVEDLTDGSGEPQGGETDVDLMTKETPQTGGLPHGWKELQDEATGNTYYWNEQTNETSWDYPHATADEDADAADVLTETEEKGVSEEVAEDEHISEQVDEHISEQVASDQDGGDRAAEPQPNENCYDIPEGWVATVDETSGNTYYYNEKTNETSWDRPVAEIKPELPSFATPKLAQRCRPAHAIATFGFGGRLCVMMPQVAASLSSTVSQPSSSDHPTMRRGPVVIHRVKDLIPRGHKFSIPSSSDSDTVGPLVKAKEKDVVSFLRQRSASPENLIWNLINIAAQNKGRLKNGDDVVDGGPEEAIVDLLLSAETGKKSSHSNAPSVQSTNSDLNDVQDLLLRGDRDRAVVEALREKNYALALIIATMCDEDIYQMVARKFADDVLSAGSPLYTTALLLTDNLPLPPGHVLRDNPRHGLSFWCEDPYQDLDTNWTQQLATILSNKRGNYTKIIMTLGDRLMQLGHCHAAHVCYLATSLSLNNPSKPSTRMVLLGCDHTVPLNRVLMTPEAVEAFERSEAFEWARRLGNKRTSFSALQPFKLRYAELLADVGHEVLAREYLLSIRSCTGIGIITRSKGNPASSYDSGFVQSLRELDDRICGSTGAERSSWNANEESSKGSLFSLGRLSALVRGKESKEEEVLTPRPESEVDPLLELDTTAPPATQSRKEEVVPPAVTKPKEEPTKPPEETGALNTSIGISNDAKQASTIDDAPASAPPSLAIGESMIDRAEDSKRNEEKLSEKLSTPSEPIKKDAKKKAPASEPPASAGLLARLFGRDKNVKVADQGEEMQAYYDDVSTKVCSSSVIF
eukprot:scaffold5613_cov210-Skeletonema_marinoi.AAC.1